MPILNSNNSDLRASALRNFEECWTIFDNWEQVLSSDGVTCDKVHARLPKDNRNLSCLTDTIAHIIEICARVKENTNWCVSW